jgi:hypothetical protein
MGRIGKPAPPSVVYRVGQVALELGHVVRALGAVPGVVAQSGVWRADESFSVGLQGVKVATGAAAGRCRRVHGQRMRTAPRVSTTPSAAGGGAPDRQSLTDDMAVCHMLRVSQTGDVAVTDAVSPPCVSSRSRPDRWRTGSGLVPQAEAWGRASRVAQAACPAWPLHRRPFGRRARQVRRPQEHLRRLRWGLGPLRGRSGSGSPKVAAV